MKPTLAELVHVKVNELKPHPFNLLLYQDSLRADEYKGLLASIQEHGVKVPLFITSSGTILSGHRRLMAAKEAGLGTVPCIVEEPESEEASIIEHNRYRRKTMSELMREAEQLIKIEGELASDRARFKDGPGGEAGRTMNRVAKTLGIGSATKLGKLKKVWEAAKTNPQIAEQMKQIDAGAKSIDAVFKGLSPKSKEDFGLDLQIYSNWMFPAPDPTLGQKHPGMIPGQVVENLIYYYTQPGDLVVDPFGGGGITVDAAKRLRRNALVMDLAPVRLDILQWDLSNGFPTEAQDAKLIFMDPPYWNMLRKEYTALSEDTAAALDLPSFQGFLQLIIAEAYKTLAQGGHLAIIMMPQSYKLPEGIPYIDWPFECRIYMDEAGFTPVARIVERWPTSIWMAQQVIDAKESKKMLQTHGDIVVGVKV